MSKKHFIIAGLMALALVGGVAVLKPAKSKAEPTARKIVIFDSSVVNEAAQEKLIAKFGGVKIKSLPLVNGMAVVLPPQANLGGEVGILRVDEDAEVMALGKPAPAPVPQTIPWGITSVGADSAWPLTAGAGIKVAVVDTGIDLTHPDLKVYGGYNAISPMKSAADDNGHGTHVAGIIAALNNSIGVVGVGPEISLYSVKVLNRSGSGYVSDIIEGLDWAIQNGIQVVNMSLGTDSDVQSFHDAIIRARDAGIVLVAAAGNDGAAVDFPGAYPEVVAVAATDVNNAVASWSSRGSEVDLAAPGVSIYSTYKGKTYKTLSGTSMATPHVAGAAALVLTTPVGAYDLDADGAWDPTEVQNKLEATATDLGDSGKDALYGAGLLNAFAAIQ